ncbi:hypothetical protein AVEN_210354-1 [Araneus ventricosus]|uniref:Uncharacterized protein n=1 Tax=Araneus ventricosus TaxID=182803 RepID=A0A4Y2GHJ6_ARAVE|nr:hypothetical protein AVEN_210354-1 [Araneus ventricosus]
MSEFNQSMYISQNEQLNIYGGTLWRRTKRLKSKRSEIPLTPSGPQNLTTFVYGGFVDIWIREMDSSAFSLFLLTVGGRKRTGA